MDSLSAISLFPLSANISPSISSFPEKCLYIAPGVMPARAAIYDIVKKYAPVYDVDAITAEVLEVRENKEK